MEACSVCHESALKTKKVRLVEILLLTDRPPSRRSRSLTLACSPTAKTSTLRPITPLNGILVSYTWELVHGGALSLS